MTSGGFLWSKRGSFEYLTCQALSARGIEHGFIGTSADFSIRGLAKYLPAFKEHFAVSELVLLDQVHGDEVVLYKEGQRNLVGDSILVPRSSVAAGKRVAFGIRVADCLPLLYLSSHGVCLVHAGWKGLAQNIHLRGIEKMSSLGPIEDIEITAWPCASLERYEVGEEVASRFLADATIVPGDTGKFYLGLRETARAQLLPFMTNSNMMHVSQECTIGDTAFHSHRRDGAASGRNLAFVIL